MLQAMRLYARELRDRYGRFYIYNSLFLRHLPGRGGEAWRAQVIPKYCARVGKNLRVHEGVRFRGIHNLSMGDHVQIGVDDFLQCTGGLELGDRVMLGPGVKIWSVNHVFDDPDIPIDEQGYHEEKVVIGASCWLGAEVFVFPGVELPEGCVVSAGSVLTKKKYPPWSLIAGYPARVIGNRRPTDEGGGSP